jgi:hypothetical protein
MNVLNKGSIAAMAVASLLAFAPAGFAMEVNSLSDLPGDEQLEAAVTHDLSSIGITYQHPENLTLSQLGELKTILEGSSSNDVKQQDAKKVLGM